MKITKIFTTESAHIVRNCSSQRCSHSIHGHSAKIELELESYKLDNAQMVYDFGLMGGTIKQFIDSLDHCYLLCSKEPDDYKEFIRKNCDRWIEMPFNPSAEMLSLFIYAGCYKILKNTKFSNGEDEFIRINSVTYHETATGRATCNVNDYYELFCKKYSIDDVVFSDGILDDWDGGLIEIMHSNSNTPIVTNPVIEQQIELN